MNSDETSFLIAQRHDILDFSYCPLSRVLHVTLAYRLISTYKIQPKTIDLSTRPWGITTEFVGFIH